MALFVFLTGAAGAGKSQLVKHAEDLLKGVKTYFVLFDNIGVPTAEEIAKQYGGSEKWRNAATIEWVGKLREYLEQNPGTKLLVLEGQFDPEVAKQECELQGITNTLFLVAHASRPIRESRLKEIRRQPELATQEMQEWADYLRKKTSDIGGSMIDTSPADPMRGVVQLMGKINEGLKAFNAA